MDRHQRDRARIVELGQARDEFVAEVAHRLEEAQAQVFVGHVGEEFAEHRIVLRPHRAHQRRLAVGELDGAFPFLRIREDGEARMAAALVQRTPARHRDAGIDGHHAFAVGQQRVDVELLDLGDVGRQLCQFDQHQRDGAFVGGRHVAVGLQHARDTGARDQLMRQAQVQWWQGDGLVVDDFHGGAAPAEGDYRPEHRVVGDAGDQFARLRPQHRRLHQYAFDACLGPAFAGAQQDAGRRLAHGVGIRQVEADAVHVGLVRDVGREDLHRHRRALGQQRRRDAAGVVGVVGAPQRRHRDAVRGEQLCGGQRIQPGLAGIQRAVHQRARQRHVGTEVFRQAGRRLHQRGLHLAMADQVHEAGDRIRLIRIARHLRGV